MGSKWITLEQFIGNSIPLFYCFRKEAKVRFHPSCDILINSHHHGKATAKESVKAITKNSDTDWFVFDEMTKSGNYIWLLGAIFILRKGKGVGGWYS